MPTGPLVPFSALLLVNFYLLREVLLDDGRVDGRVRNEGLADLRLLATDQEHLAENHGIAYVPFELLQPKPFADRYPILLSARFNHCVHALLPALHPEPWKAPIAFAKPFFRLRKGGILWNEEGSVNPVNFRAAVGPTRRSGLNAVNLERLLVKCVLPPDDNRLSCGALQLFDCHMLFVVE